MMKGNMKCLEHVKIPVALYVGIALFGVFIKSVQGSTEETSLYKTFGTSPSEQAYNLFFLSLAEEDVKQEDADRRIVLKDGVVQSGWIPVSKNDNHEGLETLFHHGQYADRISFEFSSGSFQNYDLRAPTCTSSDLKLARPKVVNFQVDVEERSGSFTVVYDCQANAKPGTVTVSVLLPVVSGLSLFYSFRKTCRGGIHDHIELGYFENSPTMESDSGRLPFSSEKEMVAGPHLMSTKLYIHLYPPAVSQEFFHTRMNTSSDKLATNTRGPIFGGVLKTSESAVIHVLYECRGSGTFNVSVTIPIYPFNELHATWKKDCGGGLAHGLSVGTNSDEVNNIVDKAVTDDRWKLALQMTSSSTPIGVPTLDASTRSTEFWLSNNGTTVHIGRPIITVEDNSVLAAFASKSSHKGTPHIQDFGGLLDSGSKAVLKLRMICMKKGTSLVVITFPVRSFSNIEFGFLKECQTPKVHVSPGFLRTASSLMMALSFVMTGGFAYWWIPRFQASSYQVLPKSAPHVRRG